jgi:uncharacterized membrane protein YsdA (DUF1294 family)/cold shock CspA family protein
MSKNRHKGIIISWKAEQGYGFIENPHGGADLFLHINDIKGKQEPKEGDLVSFQLRPPKNGGKPATYNAKLMRWDKRNILEWCLIGITASIPFMLSLAIVAHNPYTLILYSSMSVLAFLMYRDDKRRAQQEKWRIPDDSLHLVQLLWGWPGALIAQKVFFHKARKKAFQGTLRFIIFVHMIIWVDYLTLDRVILKTIIALLELVAES